MLREVLHILDLLCNTVKWNIALLFGNTKAEKKREPSHQIGLKMEKFTTHNLSTIENILPNGPHQKKTG